MKKDAFDLSDIIIVLGICIFYTGVYFLMGVPGVAIFLGLVLIWRGVELGKVNQNDKESDDE